MGVGGRAAFLCDIFDLESLKRIIRWLKQIGIDYMVIGSATNIIFSDQGYPGVLLRLGGTFKRLWIDRGDLMVGAGMELANLIQRSLRMGYGGLEPLYGIPGTVGGAIKGNGGAFGKAIGNFVERIWVIDKNGEEMMLFKDKIGFSYRSTNLDPGLAITSAELKLSKGKARIMRAENFRKRRLKKMPEGKSAGCIFRNPEEGSAGRIIEECGLKGHHIGGAFISDKHANFIINDGSAAFNDIMRLIRLIKSKAASRGIDLELEVNVVK